MDHLEQFYKAEDPAAYKKLAEKGIMVGFPVSIGGKTHREDNGIGYHSTVKFFNPDKDSPEAIHEIASKMNMVPPDPKKTKIEPGQFKDRFGNDVYVLKMHGDDAAAIKTHNDAFAHMGYPATFSYTPHVSVDKKTWDNVVASKAETAHEAGISFGHAELKQGHTTLAQYRHKKPEDAAVPTKLAASEPESNDLSKASLKDAAVGAAMGVAAMTAGAPSATSQPINHQQQAAATYSSKKMLHTIASVESSGGKFANHHMLHGNAVHGEGEQAFGAYGLTPAVIRDTVRMHPELKAKYGKATNLKGADMTRFMQDNPHLENQVAEKHLARLEHHFGKDPEKIGYAWLNGIEGTYKAGKENKDISQHWHVKKISHAYGQGK